MEEKLKTALAEVLSIISNNINLNDLDEVDQRVLDDAFLLVFPRWGQDD